MRDRHPIQTYLTPTERRRLRQEATDRGISVSKCLADCLREYFAIKMEMVSALTSPGEVGEPSAGGIMHALLARTEERLAATLDRQAGELLDRARLLESMLDRFTLFYLLHTPEVAEQLQAGALTSATRRYANYRRAVDKLVRAGGINANGGMDGDLDEGAEA